ncbi:MAG: hypothetical protein IJF45_03210, partial [Clostridia bacterium]|nr:hypothetical protein [Clostridia bacterium]
RPVRVGGHEQSSQIQHIAGVFNHNVFNFVIFTRRFWGSYYPRIRKGGGTLCVKIFEKEKAASRARRLFHNRKNCISQ